MLRQRTDKAHIDFETFSCVDLLKAGAYAYAQHPSTEVLIVGYQLPTAATPTYWLPWCQRPPKDLIDYVESGAPIGAHNAAFERLIWRHVLCPTYGVPQIADSAWVCTAAKAATCGLPRSLDKALEACGLTEFVKDKEGKRLIPIFSKPRKPTKANTSTRIMPEDSPEDFDAFVQYCMQDVVCEIALDNHLPNLPRRERDFFQLDFKMNDRGVPIDIPLVEKGITVSEKLAAVNTTKVLELSGGITGTQTAKLLDYLRSRGIEIANLQAATVRQVLDTDIPKDIRELLTLRLEAGKSSVKKLKAMQLCAHKTRHVVQGMFLIYGAHTWRYAGRLVQPHNFIRGNLTEAQRETVFKALGYGDADLMLLMYANPIDTIGQCMRGFIRAPKGYELAVVDYSAIEARVLAWLAGEQYLLDAFYAGADVYKVMAAKLYRTTEKEVTSEQRRIGKNLVLGCGYSLGGERFVEYAANAGVELTPEFAKEAVKAYRNTNTRIVESWKTIENLCSYAIRNPTKSASALGLTVKMYKHWLEVWLPSGRPIRYPYARAVPVEKWGKPTYEISFRTDHHGRFLREQTYGGKLIENVVQGIARDIMMEGMMSAENGGYKIIGTVHDEIWALRKKGSSSIKELETLVCTMPEWAAGIPLNAEGFVKERYEK